MNLQTIDKFKKRIITDIILLCYATKDHDMLREKKCKNPKKIAVLYAKITIYIYVLMNI